MRVDDPWHGDHAIGVDDGDALGGLDGFTDLGDLAVPDEDRPLGDRFAGDGEDGGVLDEDVAAGREGRRAIFVELGGNVDEGGLGLLLLLIGLLLFGTIGGGVDFDLFPRFDDGVVGVLGELVADLAEPDSDTVPDLLGVGLGNERHGEGEPAFGGCRGNGRDLVEVLEGRLDGHGDPLGDVLGGGAGPIDGDRAVGFLGLRVIAAAVGDVRRRRSRTCGRRPARRGLRRPPIRTGRSRRRGGRACRPRSCRGGRRPRRSGRRRSSTRPGRRRWRGRPRSRCGSWPGSRRSWRGRR